MTGRAIPVSLGALALVAALVACSSSPEPLNGPHETATSAQSPAPFASITATSRAQEAKVRTEYVDRLMSCIRGMGYDVRAQDDGSYRIEAAALDNGAEEECRKKLGPEPTPAPITAGEASWLYDANLAAKKCLEAHGVEVSDPPSREVYVQDYLAMRAPWTPYAEVGSRYDDVCPQPDPVEMSTPTP